MRLSYEEFLLLEANAEYEQAVQHIQKQLENLGNRTAFSKDEVKQLQKQQNDLLGKLKQEHEDFYRRY